MANFGTGFSFGATTQPKTGTVQPFSLGSQFPASTTSSAISGLNLSIPKSVAPTTGLPVGATNPSLSFGLPKSTAAGIGTAPSFGFSLPTASTAAAATTSAAFGFGTAGAATATPATGFFGAPAATSTQAAPFAFNQAGIGTAPGLSLIPSTNVAPSKGLGGVNFSGSGGSSLAAQAIGSAGAIASVGGTSGESKHGKDVVIPAEVVATVEEFKKSLAEQKQIREALLKYSDAPLARTRDELTVVRAAAAQLGSGLQRRIAQTRTLRQDLTHHERNVSLLKRLSETTPGIDSCGATASCMQYFSEVVSDAEQRLLVYKQEVENLESLLSGVEDGMMNKLAQDAGPNDLSNLLRRVHEGFIAVAAHLQSVHEETEGVRAAFIRRRREMGDNTSDTNMLPSRRRKMQQSNAQRGKSTKSQVSPYGPSPFEGGASLTGFDARGGLDLHHHTNLSSNTGTQAHSLGFTSGLGFRGNATGQASLTGASTGSSGFGFSSTFSSTAGGTLFGGAATNTALFDKAGSVARPPSAPGSTLGPENTLFGGYSSPATGAIGASGFQLQNPPLGKKKR